MKNFLFKIKELFVFAFVFIISVFSKSDHKEPEYIYDGVEDDHF